jgi:hypothetical protein
MGLYWGPVSSPCVCEVVESSDVVVCVGAGTCVGLRRCRTELVLDYVARGRVHRCQQATPRWVPETAARALTVKMPVVSPAAAAVLPPLPTECYQTATESLLRACTGCHRRVKSNKP